MLPDNYTEVSRWGYDLYKVVRDGKTGLIHSDGTVVVPIKYDAITSFYEHKSLVVKAENGKERVVGCLTDKGIYMPFTNIYYTLNGQRFYSDGLLSVADEEGRVGYIDEKGNPMLGFNGKYDRIKPFSEGYAVVFKNKKFSLIDRNENKVLFIIGLGEVHGGTNVHNGIAYIWDTDGKFYTYDVSSGKCRSIKRLKDIRLDYLYCFSSVSGRTKEIPYTQLPSGTIGLKPIGNNGKLGYSIGDKEILPCQLSSATVFEDNFAVVGLDGKLGILKYVDHASDFSLSNSQTHIVYTPGSDVSCSFSLSVPQVWSDKDKDIVVIDKLNNEKVSICASSNQYTFAIKPQGIEKKYDISVFSEGLKLWSEQVTYTFEKKQEIKLEVSVTVNGSTADEHDMIPVTATIRNPGTEAVTAVVNMTGSDTFVKISKTVTIAAGSTVQVNSCFLVKKACTNQFVQVTTSKGGTALKNGLSFESFY